MKTILALALCAVALSACMSTPTPELRKNTRSASICPADSKGCGYTPMLGERFPSWDQPTRPRNVTP